MSIKYFTAHKWILLACFCWIAAGAAVLEKGSLLYIDPAQMIDLTPEARILVGIPEGRTLEMLQAELQAKAQAAQMQ